MSRPCRARVPIDIPPKGPPVRRRRACPPRGRPQHDSRASRHESPLRPTRQCIPADICRLSSHPRSGASKPPARAGELLPSWRSAQKRMRPALLPRPSRQPLPDMAAPISLALRLGLAHRLVFGLLLGLPLGLPRPWAGHAHQRTSLRLQRRVPPRLRAASPHPLARAASSAWPLLSGLRSLSSKSSQPSSSISCNGNARGGSDRTRCSCCGSLPAHARTT